MEYDELVDLYKELLEKFSQYLLSEFNTDESVSYYIDQLDLL